MSHDPVTRGPGADACGRSSGTVRQLWRTVATDRPTHAARLALRTRSSVVREALALAVSGGTLGDADLLELIREGRLPDSFLTSGVVRRLAALAMVWAGEGRSRVELDAAAWTFLAIWDATDGARFSAHHHRIAAQSLFLTGRVHSLRRLLPDLALRPADRWSLTTDLANPYKSRASATAIDPSNTAGHAVWEQLLSAPFIVHGLTPLAVRPSTQDARAPHPFDRLSTTGSSPGSVDGPLVSVVMPCYQPDQGLLTSLSSICAQTYGPLQILLVDDASGPQAETWFERALALDERITLYRMPRNGGSYLARNEALRASNGEFVTFQDADDWSHPQRVEAQVALLTDTPERAASLSRAVRAHDDLTHQWIGYRARRVNVSSLMVRSSVVAQLGPFLPIRKGADSEYVERIAAQAGPLAYTRTPLAIVRLRPGSVSRSDFAYGWTTPDRLAFREIYRAWHRAGQGNDAPMPLTFVRGLSHSDRMGDRLGVAYVGDFSADPDLDPGRTAALWAGTEEQQSAPDAAQAGRRVGIWHLEVPWTARAKRPEMHGSWFDRIVETAHWQALTRVEPVHVKRLVVLDPSVLLLAGGQECRVSADQVEVRLRPEDGEPVAAGPPVDLEAVGEVVRQWFGVDPRWVHQQDPATTAPDQPGDSGPTMSSR